jgi:catechol 2,3-dioxygenase-like lactoylglutathione lyase family enzyme
MLRDRTSTAILAVSDIARARKFYQETLGLELLAEASMDDVLTFRTGDTRLVVYRSDEAGTNRANALVWDANGEIEEIVKDIKAKGVQFEHYDMDGIRLEGDIHVAGTMKMAWFKDPDGNILHLNAM